jgi:hypothetical protein
LPEWELTDSQNEPFGVNQEDRYAYATKTLIVKLEDAWVLSEERRSRECLDLHMLLELTQTPSYPV